MSFMIDASHYQGNINFAALKSAGCVGLMVKTTDGATGVDATWQANRAGAKAVGIPVAPYHFSEDGNAQLEAANFAKVWAAGWDFRPWLDEEKSTARPAFIRDFRSTFRGITNYPLFGVYSSQSLLAETLNPANWIDAQTGIWAARYAASLGWSHPQLLVWQYSSAATIAGVVGHVDEDEFMNGWTPVADQGEGMSFDLSTQIPVPQLDAEGNYIGDKKDANGNVVTASFSDLVRFADVTAAFNMTQLKTLTATVVGQGAAITALVQNGQVTAAELTTIIDNAVAQHLQITGSGTFTVTGAPTSAS